MSDHRTHKVIGPSRRSEEIRATSKRKEEESNVSDQVSYMISILLCLPVRCALSTFAIDSLHDGLLTMKLIVQGERAKRWRAMTAWLHLSTCCVGVESYDV